MLFQHFHNERCNEMLSILLQVSSFIIETALICLIYLLTTPNVRPTTKPKFNAPNHKAILLLDLFDFLFALKFYQQNSLFFRSSYLFGLLSYWTNESNFPFIVCCVFSVGEKAILTRNFTEVEVFHLFWPQFLVF